MRRIPTIVGALIVVLAVVTQPVLAQVPGQVPLNPRNIPQFVDPLPHFAGQRLDATAGGSLTVNIMATTQIAVSTGTRLALGTVTKGGTIGLANLWAYELQYGGTTKPVSWPAFTIEARRGTGSTALNVTYNNMLVGARYSDVGLVVDQTLHAAIPMAPPTNLSPYTGPVPTTVHLHGGEVPPASDGGPDSWFMPGNTTTGHAFNVGPYLYPNTQEPATLWFHDHALGVTRLNVYAGMAGFYFLREANEDNLKLPGWSGDGTVQEVAPPGTSGTFNPDPYLPEIEIAIQDRMFDTNGGLYFPSVGLNPEHPFWVPEFVGDVITVNGKTWPYLSVAARTYRFRILNGSNARFYNLSFPRGGPTITQIGTDGGFLDAPVPLANGPLLIAPGERADVIIDFTGLGQVANKKGKLTAPKTFVLTNDARTPFPGGGVVQGSTTGRIMQFVVNGTLVSPDASDPAAYASLKTNVKLADFGLMTPAAGVPVLKTRQLTLNEVMGPGGPLEVLVNNTKWSGQLGQSIRLDFKPVTNSDGTTTYYSETVDEGTTEIWQIINQTADAHPIHLHLVQFQLVSREPYDAKVYDALYNASFPTGAFVGGYGPPLDYNADQRLAGETMPTIGGNPNVKPYLLGAPRPANPNEQGWKDTFIMYPGEVTTVIARWAPTDKLVTDPAASLIFPFNPNAGHGYVWHCHIIDHEDNEMMRPYDVNPMPGAPRTWASVGDIAQSSEMQMTEETPAEKPISFELAQNYPNPFNPSTEIRFALPEDSHVRLTLYNAVGQEVQTLIDADAPAGVHTVKVDAGSLASGVYVYRIQAGGFVSSKKMMLMR